MEKADVIAQQKQAIIDGQSAVIEQALGAAFDANTGGGFSQADLDQAKADGAAAQAISDQAAVDALTQQVSALQADDDAKTKIIQGIQALLSPPAPQA